MNKIISTPVANLYNNHSFMSSQVTQGLMGEKVEIIDEFESWFKIQQWDSYQSWVHNFHLGEVKNHSDKTCKLLQKTSQIRLPQTKGSIEVPFGVELEYFRKNDAEIEVVMPWGEIGIVNDNRVVESKNFRQQIISHAQKLLGVHYHWGGISSFGCDCSGFVQTILKSVNILYPRDSDQQSEIGENTNIDSLNSGDLIFFGENNKVNHVAISLGNSRIIHCSGMVKEESLSENDQDFNGELLEKIISCKSIDAYLR